MTITGGTLNLRRAGILLNADVTFRDVELSFSNGYHNAIFANGHTLTLENVRRSANGREIHLFAGGLYENTIARGSGGSHGQIILSGTSTDLGNVYGGSMDGPFHQNATITITGTMDLDTIYASGAATGVYDFNNYLDPNNAPEAPKADAALYPVYGDVAINLRDSSVRVVDGLADGSAGAQQMATVSLSTQNLKDNLALSNIGAIIVESGRVKPTALNDGISVSVQSGAILDLSGVMVNNAFTVGTFQGGGTLQLGQMDTLTITGEVSGTTAFEVSGGFNGKSALAEENHGYIDVSQARGDGIFTFDNPYDTQSNLILENKEGVWTTILTETTNTPATGENDSAGSPSDGDALSADGEDSGTGSEGSNDKPSLVEEGQINTLSQGSESDTPDNLDDRQANLIPKNESDPQATALTMDAVTSADQASTVAAGGDPSQRVIEYKDITSIQVYGQDGTLQQTLPTAGLNVGEYLVKVNMQDLPGFYATVKNFSETNGVLSLELNTPGTQGDVLTVEYGPTSSGTATAKEETTVASGTYLTSLSGVNGYVTGSEIAYKNVYQLMPFFTGADIVLEGNQIMTGHILGTTGIKEILPMDTKEELVTYLTKETPDRITTLKVVFEDGTVEDYGVTYYSTVGSVANYQIAGLNLTYSFDRYLISDTDPAVTALTNHIQGTDYATYLGLLSGSVSDNRSLRDYYETVKAEANSVALSLLSNAPSLTPTASHAAYDAILAEAQKKDAGSQLLKLLYTYNYYQRFYNFKVGSVNVADVLLFRGGLFSGDMTLKALASGMATSTADSRGGAKTHVFYIAQLAKYTGKNNAGLLVDWFIDTFTEYAVPDDWFTSVYGSRGILYEAKSKFPNFDYRAWTQLKKRPDWLLPFLTLPDGSYYLLSMPGQVMVGSPKTYFQDSESTESKAQMLTMMKDFSKKSVYYMETVASIINDDARINNLLTISMDYRAVKNEQDRHVFQYMEAEALKNTSWTATEEPFFKNYTEVIGVWKETTAGAAALGGGETIYWMAMSVLGAFNTWSHEMAHVIDIPLILKGSSMRGIKEDAATGLVDQKHLNDGTNFFNLAYDFDITADISSNLTTARIDSPEEAQSFYAAMFDTLDLLDYIEAKAFLQLTPEEQTKIAYKLYYGSDPKYAGVGYWYFNLYALDEWWALPYPFIVAENRNLSTLADLYDAQIVLRPGTRPDSGRKFMEMGVEPYVYDSIYTRWWHWPHYNGGDGDSYTRKTMAFRMLGEAGYDKGLIQYFSRRSANDLDGLQKITGHADFRARTLARWDEVESKLQDIAYLDAEVLQEQYLAALREDAANGDRDLTNATKLRQLNYYFLKRMTNDFTESIYGTDDPVVPISTLDDLKAIANKPNGNYALVNDIDLSSAAGSAVVDCIFVGKLDGRGHTLYGTHLPVFTQVKHAYVNDLTVLDTRAESIASTVTNSSLSNVTVQMDRIPISTVEEFLDIQDAPNEMYILINDIDFSSYTPQGSNQSLIEATFTGSLEGAGYALKNLTGASLFKQFNGKASNLKITGFTNEVQNGNYVNAFAQQTNGAKLRNIHFSNITLSGQHRVAVVAGMDQSNSVFERISITNTQVHSTGYCNALLVGRKYGGSITDVQLEGTLHCSATESGGLIGASQNSVTVNRVISNVDLVMGTNTDS